MGELNCSAKVAKLILTICNLVVMLAGVAMVAVGIWFVADPKATTILRVTESASSTTRTLVGAAGGIVILAGFLLFVVGVIGFYGALSHRTCCLNCFSAILIMLVILQVVAAIMAGVFHGKITTGLTNSMNQTMKLYISNSAIQESWNFMQYEFGCCGIANQSDWQNVNWTTDTPQPPVPLTCCVLNNTDYVKPIPKNQDQCYNDAKESPQKSSSWVYKQGCEKKFEQWLTNQLGALIGIAVAVVFVEVAGVILSCLLTSRIKSGYEYV